MNIAIMSCTGAVGKEFINLIEERKLNYLQLRNVIPSALARLY